MEWRQRNEMRYTPIRLPQFIFIPRDPFATCLYRSMLITCYARWFQHNIPVATLPHAWRDFWRCSMLYQVALVTHTSCQSHFRVTLTHTIWCLHSKLPTQHYNAPWSESIASIRLHPARSFSGWAPGAGVRRLPATALARDVSIIEVHSPPLRKAWITFSVRIVPPLNQLRVCQRI